MAVLLHKDVNCNLILQN